MKTISPTTTAGHSAIHRLVLIITLYFGLAIIAHQKPEIIRSRTAPMLTPNETDEKDDNNIIININDNPTIMKSNQQNAHAHLGGNQRARAAKQQQKQYI